jgi:hypothetical protein
VYIHIFNFQMDLSSSSATPVLYTIAAAATPVLDTIAAPVGLSGHLAPPQSSSKTLTITPSSSSSSILSVESSSLSPDEGYQTTPSGMEELTGDDYSTECKKKIAVFQ